MGRDDMCEDCRRLTAGGCGKHEDSWAPRPPLVVGRIDLCVQTNALAPASAQIESLGRLVGEQAKRIAALEAERDRLRAFERKHEEDEAACCPEDVGFKEYIQALMRRIAGLETERDEFQEKWLSAERVRVAAVAGEAQAIAERDRLRNALGTVEQLLLTWSGEPIDEGLLNLLHDEIDGAAVKEP